MASSPKPTPNASAQVTQLTQQIQQEAVAFRGLLNAMRRVIVGQDALLHRLLMALLADGHVLIEGVPGLAKTLTVRTLAATINADFQRIQFTPDLLPADLVGTQVYNPSNGTFTPHPGPVFCNLLLADEVNRAPAKVQSALLEAMEERQVTLGDETRRLDALFMVLATQNPIEQEGTYPLPEAQLDRFMFKVIVSYPDRDEEREIMRRMSAQSPAPPAPVLDRDVLFRARALVNQVYVDAALEDYVLDIVLATRDPAAYGFEALAPLIAFGASPRATIYLLRAARARAFLQGRGYASPDDVKGVVLDVLRHRVLLSFEAEAESVTSEQVVRQIVGGLKLA